MYKQISEDFILHEFRFSHVQTDTHAHHAPFYCRQNNNNNDKIKNWKSFPCNNFSVLVLPSQFLLWPLCVCLSVLWDYVLLAQTHLLHSIYVFIVLSFVSAIYYLFHFICAAIISKYLYLFVFGDYLCLYIFFFFANKKQIGNTNGRRINVFTPKYMSIEHWVGFFYLFFLGEIKSDAI